MTDTGVIWQRIHSERVALADDLADLDEKDWATPSLCAGMTVRQVLAHMTSAGVLTGPRWLAGVIRCRFDFDKQVAMRTAEQMGNSGADTLARFRRILRSTTSPPLPKRALLGEVVVHGTDIRTPLGQTRAYPVGLLTDVAEYYGHSDQVVLAKTRVAGLRLTATDGPFRLGAAGDAVEGSTLALIMAMTGRSHFLGQLSGPGVDVLRARC